MKVVFDEKEIRYSDNCIPYDDLKNDNMKNAMYRLLTFCINNENDISFICTDSCLPFGKKLKETLEEEFMKHDNVAE